MRALAATALLALAVGYVLAHFGVALYNHWYFAEYFWLKVALTTPVVALVYGVLLWSSWRPVWLVLGAWWVVVHLAAMLPARGPDLRALEFVAVLDLEIAVVWVPAGVLVAYDIWRSIKAGRAQAAERRAVARELELRRRLRTRREAEMEREGKGGGGGSATTAALILLVSALGLIALPGAVQADDDGDSAAPLVVDRHEEFTNPALTPPEWPAHLPTPMHERQPGRWFNIRLDNWPGGEIIIYDQGTDTHEIGHVISPVTAVNPRAFTAAGWAETGTVCASAVNAIHIKTDHEYVSGRSSIFSILPLEMAEVDPQDYKSYLSHETSLQTDIPGGSDIFGGRWAPLVGSTIVCWPGGDPKLSYRVELGWVPSEGDIILVQVAHRRYNPEYIEFENRFGGLILIKEQGEEPYPVGQVLKPVVGIGRFLGTQYADVGRIRAAHPGVICISTSPLGVIGGFQIIPRDHAMSREMRFARTKTQWMVVGPLWALDPSWEGVPPLFSDYIYPAYIPAVVAGEVNDEFSAMEIYLGRFTVRGRYADGDDPERYVLLREAEYLDHYALKDLTHIRIYFPAV